MADLNNHERTARFLIYKLLDDDDEDCDSLHTGGVESGAAAAPGEESEKEKTFVNVSTFEKNDSNYELTNIRSLKPEIKTEVDSALILAKDLNAFKVKGCFSVSRRDVHNSYCKNKKLIRQIIRMDLDSNVELEDEETCEEVNEYQNRSFLEFPIGTDSLSSLNLFMLLVVESKNVKYINNKIRNIFLRDCLLPTTAKLPHTAKSRTINNLFYVGNSTSASNVLIHNSDWNFVSQMALMRFKKRLGAKFESVYIYHAHHRILLDPQVYLETFLSKLVDWQMVSLVQVHIANNFYVEGKSLFVKINALEKMFSTNFSKYKKYNSPTGGGIVLAIVSQLINL